MAAAPDKTPTEPQIQVAVVQSEGVEDNSIEALLGTQPVNEIVTDLFLGEQAQDSELQEIVSFLRTGVLLNKEK